MQLEYRAHLMSGHVASPMSGTGHLTARPAHRASAQLPKSQRTRFALNRADVVMAALSAAWCFAFAAQQLAQP